MKTLRVSALSLALAWPALMGGCSGKLDLGALPPPTPDASVPEDATLFDAGPDVAMTGDALMTHPGLDASGLDTGASPACSYEAGSVSLSDGSGYIRDEPVACTQATGSRHTFSSVSDVAAFLVGAWSVCAVSGSPLLPSGDDAIQFTAAGRFSFMTGGADGSLVAMSGADSQGAITVTDSSATNGPGSFSLQLQPDSGGTYVGQVIVTDGPEKLRLLFNSPSTDDFARADTFLPQKGICGPAFGPQRPFKSASDVTASLLGRWVSCPAAGGGACGVSSAIMGCDFEPDGTWYGLVEDDTGHLVRATYYTDHGTYTVATAAPFLLTLWTTGNGSSTMQPVASYCPRALEFTWQSGGSGIYMPSP